MSFGKIEANFMDIVESLAFYLSFFIACRVNIESCSIAQKRGASIFLERRNYVIGIWQVRK